MEEAKNKVNQLENTSNKTDPNLKIKLQKDLEKKTIAMEKTYNELTMKENVSRRVTKFSENNEKKVSIDFSVKLHEKRNFL